MKILQVLVLTVVLAGVFVTPASGQVVVHDPTAFLQQLLDLVVQVSSLYEQYATYYENYKQVRLLTKEARMWGSIPEREVATLFYNMQEYLADEEAFSHRHPEWLDRFQELYVDREEVTFSTLPYLEQERSAVRLETAKRMVQALERLSANTIPTQWVIGDLQLASTGAAGQDQLLQAAAASAIHGSQESSKVGELLMMLASFEAQREAAEIQEKASLRDAYVDWTSEIVPVRGWAESTVSWPPEGW